MSKYGRYNQKQFLARMKYSTYLKIRRFFPARRNETVAGYFQRVAEWMGEQ